MDTIVSFLVENCNPCDKCCFFLRKEKGLQTWERQDVESVSRWMHSAAERLGKPLAPMMQCSCSATMGLLH